jgi:hypothetical protein
MKDIKNKLIQYIKDKGLRPAHTFKIKPSGAGIQLYDKDYTPLEGHKAYWDGDLDLDPFWCQRFNPKPEPLISLGGCPAVVLGDFRCKFNPLKSLQGAPLYVGGDFDCIYTHLTTLEGGPKVVGGDYSCSYSGLESLKGAPEYIPGQFNCVANKLKNLRFGPRVVGGGCDCSYNRFLTSLEGCPDRVGGSLVCEGYILPKNYTLPEVNYKIKLDDPAA